MFFVRIKYTPGKDVAGFIGNTLAHIMESPLSADVYFRAKLSCTNMTNSQQHDYTTSYLVFFPRALKIPCTVLPS